MCMTLFYHIPLTCWVCSIAVLQVTNYATVEGLGTRQFEMLLAKEELEGLYSRVFTIMYG